MLLSFIPYVIDLFPWLKHLTSAGNLRYPVEESKAALAIGQSYSVQASSHSLQHDLTTYKGQLTYHVTSGTEPNKNTSILRRHHGELRILVYPESRRQGGMERDQLKYRGDGSITLRWILERRMREWEVDIPATDSVSGNKLRYCRCWTLEIYYYREFIFKQQSS
jgi:hypothetical protein